MASTNGHRSRVNGFHVPGKPQFSGYLIVGYSNPDATGLPNHLCFRVPLVRGRSAHGAGRSLCACFARESMTPLAKGLYWEDGEPKCDYVEDMYRLWEPIRRCFWAHEAAQTREFWVVGNDFNPDAESLTLAGISYQDSIRELVQRWSLSPEELHNA